MEFLPWEKIACATPSPCLNKVAFPQPGVVIGADPLLRASLLDAHTVISIPEVCFAV
jgi:hypothetical protein